MYLIEQVTLHRDSLAPGNGHLHRGLVVDDGLGGQVSLKEIQGYQEMGICKILRIPRNRHDLGESWGHPRNGHHFIRSWDTRGKTSQTAILGGSGGIIASDAWRGCYTVGLRGCRLCSIIVTMPLAVSFPSAQTQE